MKNYTTKYFDPLSTDHSKNNFRIIAQKSLINLADTITPSALQFKENFFRGKNKESIVNIFGDSLKNIIETNKLNVKEDELISWLESDSSSVKEDEKIAEIDEIILPELVKNAALVNRGFSAGFHDTPVLDTKTRAWQLCRIKVESKDGRILSTGTGFFVTNELLMTCYHVINNPKINDLPFSELKINVHVPHYHGKNKVIRGVTAWSEIVFSVKESLGAPLMHLFSPNLSKEQETQESWSHNPPEKESLDYCILEIDEASEKWTISVVASRNVISNVNQNFVLDALPNQLPAIFRPATLYHAEELDGQTVSVHTLSTELEVKTVPGGSVKTFSKEFNRVRYGDGSGIEVGDSGCPIINQEYELVALHNAYTGKHSQAIPIGPIYEDIKKRNKHIFDMMNA